MRIIPIVIGTALAISAGAAQCHSLSSGNCAGKIGPGDAHVNITVQTNGAISGTAGASELKPFTARVQPNDTVNIYRGDGTLWYEGATMRDGWLFAKLHRTADNGGGVFQATLRCATQAASN